jgi:hypothetical protein
MTHFGGIGRARTLGEKPAKSLYENQNSCSTWRFTPEDGRAAVIASGAKQSSQPWEPCDSGYPDARRRSERSGRIVIYNRAQPIEKAEAQTNESRRFGILISLWPAWILLRTALILLRMGLVFVAVGLVFVPLAGAPY